VLRASPAIQLHVARDGEDAMAFLGREGAHARAPRPYLVLLDLNLPGMGGPEVLALIKGNESLKTILTMTLTSSEAEADILKSYQLQANCYLCKPTQIDAFDSLLESINDLWLVKAKRPRRTGA
jgi:chemotaxis family two-component system response regulator Rcp1